MNEPSFKPGPVLEQQPKLDISLTAEEEAILNNWPERPELTPRQIIHKTQDREQTCGQAVFNLDPRWQEVKVKYDFENPEDLDYFADDHVRGINNNFWRADGRRKAGRDDRNLLLELDDAQQAERQRLERLFRKRLTEIRRIRARVFAEHQPPCPTEAVFKLIKGGQYFEYNDFEEPSPFSHVSSGYGNKRVRVSTSAYYGYVAGKEVLSEQEIVYFPKDETDKLGDLETSLEEREKIVAAAKKAIQSEEVQAQVAALARNSDFRQAAEAKIKIQQKRYHDFLNHPVIRRIHDAEKQAQANLDQFEKVKISVKVKLHKEGQAISPEQSVLQASPVRPEKMDRCYQVPSSEITISPAIKKLLDSVPETPPSAPPKPEKPKQPEITPEQRQEMEELYDLIQEIAPVYQPRVDKVTDKRTKSQLNTLLSGVANAAYDLRDPQEYNPNKLRGLRQNIAQLDKKLRFPENWLELYQNLKKTMAENEDLRSYFNQEEAIQKFINHCLQEILAKRLTIINEDNLLEILDSYEF